MHGNFRNFCIQCSVQRLVKSVSEVQTFFAPKNLWMCTWHLTWWWVWVLAKQEVCCSRPHARFEHRSYVYQVSYDAEVAVGLNKHARLCWWMRPLWWICCNGRCMCWNPLILSLLVMSVFGGGGGGPHPSSWYFREAPNPLVGSQILREDLTPLTSSSKHACSKTPLFVAF